MKHSIQKSARPESPLYGPTRYESVGCDGGSFSAPKESCKADHIGEASYFTIQELSASATAERLAIDNTPPHAARTMLTILVEQILDPIRRRYGAPIIVTSGYRCPALNTAVGGVTNSHHIIGCAADITTGTIENNHKIFDLITDMQTTHAIRFTQLIAEEGYRWLHISYVPGMLRNQVMDVNENIKNIETPVLDLGYQDSG